jgi:hypothetical protein
MNKKKKILKSSSKNNNAIIEDDEDSIIDNSIIDNSIIEDEIESTATGVAQVGDSNRAFMFQMRIIPFSLKDLKEVQK